jgi:hypothetical protein
MVVPISWSQLASSKINTFITISSSLLKSSCGTSLGMMLGQAPIQLCIALMPTYGWMFVCITVASSVKSFALGDSMPISFRVSSVSWGMINCLFHIMIHYLANSFCYPVDSTDYRSFQYWILVQFW